MPLRAPAASRGLFRQSRPHLPPSPREAATAASHSRWPVSAAWASRYAKMAHDIAPLGGSRRPPEPRRCRQNTAEHSVADAGASIVKKSYNRRVMTQPRERARQQGQSSSAARTGVRNGRANQSIKRNLKQSIKQRISCVAAHRLAAARPVTRRQSGLATSALRGQTSSARVADPESS